LKGFIFKIFNLNMDLLVPTFMDLNFDFNIILYLLLINDYTILKFL